MGGQGTAVGVEWDVKGTKEMDLLSLLCQETEATVCQRPDFLQECNISELQVIGSDWG